MLKIFTLLLLLIPGIIFGQTTYSPLIEGGVLEGIDTNDLGAYINALYLLSISIAALLATIKLIIAGAKYMLSDVVTTQGEAKKEIQTSLLGLLLVISAVLILTIINPQLISNQLTLNKVGATRDLPAAQTSTEAGTNSLNTVTKTEESDSGNKVTSYDFSKYTNTRHRQTAIAAKESECHSQYGLYDLAVDKKSATCALPKSFIVFKISGSTGGRGNPSKKQEELAEFKKNCTGTLVDKHDSWPGGKEEVCVVR